MSRPKKPKAKVKSVIVVFRVTVAEHKTLRRAADHMSLDLSSWVRMVSLERARGAGQ